MRRYDAPWGRLTIVVTTVVVILCAVVAAGTWFRARGPARWYGALPVAILAGTALFAVRGYVLTRDAILVRRPLWTTRLPLKDLQSAKFEAGAMRGSIRTFGNGGLFAFTGHFRSRTLGRYRAYVTDLQRTVVLRFPSSTVVLSPSMPEEFVEALRSIERFQREGAHPRPVGG